MVGNRPSSGGEALRDLLLGRRGAGLVHLARAPLDSRDVLAQAFTVAVRRRFATETDLRAVTRYVAEALPRQNLKAGGRLAREAEALIRTVLGEDGLRDGISQSDMADLYLAIVVDLVHSQQFTPEQVDALVMEAESRVARFGRHGSGRRRPGLLARLGIRGSA